MLYPKTILFTKTSLYQPKPSQMYPVYFLTALILFVTHHVFSQQSPDKSIASQHRTILMLEKRNKNKTVYYSVGDIISFKTKGRKSKITGEILDFKDSLLVFKGYEINVTDIKCLYIDEKTKWWLRFKIAQLSLIIGTGYLLIDAINTGELNKNTLAISGTIIGVGLIAKLLISNKIKIRGRTKLRILKL